MINGLQSIESQITDPTNALWIEDTITAMLREKQTASECDQEQTIQDEFAVAESAGMAANLPSLIDGAAILTEDSTDMENSPKR